MIRLLSLRARIGLLFGLMAIIVVIGGASMLWYTSRIDTMLVTMVNKEFVLYRTAQELELALANQKGLLTYYLVDGDGKWLNLLGQYRQSFYQLIDEAQRLDLTARQRQALKVIAEKYYLYTKAKDVAIDNYRKVPWHGGSISSLHEKQRTDFFAVLELCREFSRDQLQVIVDAEAANSMLSRTLRGVATVAIALFTLLGSVFLLILYRNILGPIRGLALETGGSVQESAKDEVDSLTQSLKGMMRDFDETSEQLARSRKNLLQAERMVMVGELAAGVAHTIRNPFTSIKMRMFSLGRSLKLNEAQREDLQVISDEIARIDRIVENFLEFARPPKLRLVPGRLSDIVRSVATLLEYRLKAYNVELVFHTEPDPPLVLVDVDRIKEALVNLVTNSCEAMEDGGRIVITERREHHPALGEAVSLTVTDSGPGIPEALVDKVVTPFFTTKEEGSGLGLSIVNRIVREHRGRFVVAAQPDQGASCTILLPIGAKRHDPDTDH